MIRGLAPLSLVVVCALAVGCGTPEEEFVRDPALDDVALTSTAADTKSHENGANCMECHSAASDAPERAGPGLFSVAGSLWAGSPGDLSPFTDAVLQLRTDAFGAGELLIELPVDANGNVYTTEDIDFFGQAVFPHIVNGNGNTLSMPFPTNSGACNMCHQPGGIELFP